MHIYALSRTVLARGWHTNENGWVEAVLVKQVGLTTTFSHTAGRLWSTIRVKGSNRRVWKGKENNGLNMSKNNSINLRILLFSILTKYFWCSTFPLLQRKFKT